MDRSSLLLAVLVASVIPMAYAAEPAARQSFDAPQPLRLDAIPPVIHLDRLGKDSFIDARAQEDAALRRAAGRIVQMIDARRTAEVGEGALASVSGADAPTDFARQLDSTRSQAGELLRRGDARVTRMAQAGDGAQADVVEVIFPARFANMEGAVDETVAFRLDDNQVWRVTDYNLALAAR
ncbi:DUF4019 domain-containing protein [Stenotrophomonas maltophilia]|uniref:DUF4019 domain-containing protein n=1 Tax=Stenotrophomonas maltophilia TaxID=40324 RepID=UPI000D0ADC61|nr:DUF4019 domain-containing protein [Stenotrophomonas maltophilia]AVO29648.1 hypothetical protein C6Y55_06740 [Stenotrophomonas maltophilia]MCU1125737.1 DUF4019 domain-containing protein [Stenotrophomonas maltophilia]